MQPYPWHRLRRVERSSLSLHSRAARQVPPLSIEALRTELRALFDDVEVREGAMHVCAPGQLAGSLCDPLVGIVLVGARARVVLELSPELALVMIDLLLGGEGAPAPATGPLTDVERGVMLYAAARLLERSPWRAATVVTSPLPIAAVVGDEGSVVWDAQLRLGSTAGVARIWMGQAAMLSETPSPVFARLQLPLCLEAGLAELPARDVASLNPGDVVVLDECWLRESGKARLRAVGAHRTLWWCERGSSKRQWSVVSMTTGLDAPVGAGASMSEHNEDPNTDPNAEVATDVVARLGDAPVVLCVELARFTMALEDLAKLRPGEIVTTARPVGEKVTLRAGEQVIAEGELVDVEGEIGVRILALLADGSSEP